MFEVGQYVVKANTGLCRITGTVLYGLPEEEKKLYYSLELAGDKKGTCLVPVDSEKSNMRPVMSKPEAQDLLEKVSEIRYFTAVQEKLREQGYRDVIKSNDPVLIVGLIKTLYSRGNERKLQGKHVTALDERYSHIAESMLYPEITLVLGAAEERIKEQIFSCIF